MEKQTFPFRSLYVSNKFQFFNKVYIMSSVYACHAATEDTFYCYGNH